LSYNTTTDVYTFSNIRYAQPPVGDLRFRAPLAPETNRSTIRNGSESITCAQGIPNWQFVALDVISPYIASQKPFNLTSWEAGFENASGTVPSDLNAHSTEDCLFLDVHVPRKVLEQTQINPGALKGASVLVWVRRGFPDLSQGCKKGSEVDTEKYRYTAEDTFLVPSWDSQPCSMTHLVYSMPHTSWSLI
jgi:hypothetical protein